MTKTLSNIDNQLGEISSKTEKANLLDRELRLKIQNHNEQKTEENFIELERLESKNRELEIDLDKLKIEVNTKLDKIEKLGDLEYDEDCDYCMKNPFTLDAIETKKLVELDKVRVKEHLNRVDDITTNIKELYHTRERKSDLDDTINKLQKVSTLINETNSSKVLLGEKRKNVLHQLTSIEEKIIIK